MGPSGQTVATAGRAVFRSLLLLQRESTFQRVTQFYTEALGLPVISGTRKYIELDAGGGVKIALKQVDGESFCTTGYSPFLSLTVTVRNVQRSSNHLIFHEAI